MGTTRSLLPSGARSRAHRCRFRLDGRSGFSFIEVLVALALLAIGLVGLSALQARAGLVSIESYQRTQALLLASDMLDRIRANKPDAALYTGDDFGVGPLAACPATPGVEFDRCEWASALAGAAETIGAQPAGTLSGGRGCIAIDETGHVEVIVAWQGLAATVPPHTDCGRDQYGDDAYRRAVVITAHLPRLEGL